jgi:hypothetical protein
VQTSNFFRSSWYIDLQQSDPVGYRRSCQAIHQLSTVRDSNSIRILAGSAMTRLWTLIQRCGPTYITLLLRFGSRWILKECGQGPTPPNRSSVSLSLSGASVATLKAMVQNKEDIPPGRQRISFRGREMDDDQRLDSYGVSEDSGVFLITRRACPQ